MSALCLRRSWRPALFVAAEVLLYLSYRHHDARFHWFLHFFVGTSAALIAMAVLTYGSARPVRFPLLWLLTGHLIAMLPDILWNLQLLPHQPWMDVFLLHISAHFMPGRNWTWYVIFLVCLAMYLSARRAAEVRVQKHPLDAP
jgi:hypothetical protein